MRCKRIETPLNKSYTEIIARNGKKTLASHAQLFVKATTPNTYLMININNEWRTCWRQSYLRLNEMKIFAFYRIHILRYFKYICPYKLVIRKIGYREGERYI